MTDNKPNPSAPADAQELLMKFGSHLHGCDIHNDPRPPAGINKCDCGYATALKTLSPVSPVEQNADEPDGFRSRVFNRNDLILEDYYYLDRLLRTTAPLSLNQEEQERK